MTPKQWQVTMSVLLVAAGLIGQAVIFARLPIPGAAPSLSLAVVIALGMSRGSTWGSVCGFSAGLLLDLAPPATGIMGVTALGLLVAGNLAGRVRDPRGLAPAQLVTIIAGISTLVAIIQVALSWALANTGAPLLSLVTFVGYTTALALLVVPAVAWLMRRVGPGYRSSARRRRVLR